MVDLNKMDINSNELEDIVTSINVKIDEYIQSLKKRSSEEILLGSTIEAQKIINQILPIETEFKKMDDCHNSFISVLRNSEISSHAKNVQHDSESEDLNNLDLSEMDFTPNELYRVPILKALIYLGGNSKLVDVAGFIEKEMKDKFKRADHEKGANGFGKLWVEMVNIEKENMVNEGLILEDKTSEQWEIVQNGIDYLAQHAH